MTPNIETITVDSIPELEKTGFLFQLTLGRRLKDEPHNHEFYEIICLLEGSCTHAISGKSRLMREGEIVLLRPPEPHLFSDQSEYTNIAAISVTVEEMSSFLKAFGFGDDPAFDFSQPEGEPPCVAMSHIGLGRFKRLCGEIFSNPPEARGELCRALMGTIFCELIMNGTRSVKIPPSFSKVLSEMNLAKNAAEGVPAFLRLSNFSHAQLCRLTKRYLSMTPGEYVNSLRMKYAWEMVAAGETDFEEISESVGFSSYSHFCHVFKNTFGTTPAKARRDAERCGRTI